MARIKKLRLSVLLEYFFDSTLLLLFMAQAFVAGCLFVYGNLPIPPGWANQLVAKQLPSGIQVNIDDFRLQLDGSIQLIGIELHSTDIQQPLLTAESAEIKLSWPNLKARPKAQSLVVSDGTLYIPSVYSPDGYHQALLEHVALRILPEQGHLRVDSFAAVHDSIRLRGTLELPIKSGDTDGKRALSHQLQKFYAQAAKLIQQKQQIRYLTEPTIAFKIAPKDAQTNQVDLQLSSRSLQHPKVNANNIELLGQFLISGNQIKPVAALRLTAEQFAVPNYEIESQGLSAEIPLEEFSALLAKKWPELELAAERIQFKTFELDAPVLRIAPGNYPQVFFKGVTRSLKGAINLQGKVDARDWSGQVRARGSVDLIKLVPDAISTKLPSIHFHAAPYYDLRLNFKPGFKLAKTKLKAEVHQLQVDTLNFDYINAHASYQDGVVSITDLYLRRKQQWLKLKFSFDTHSSDYKISLLGSAVPYDYNSLLPHWWSSIFKDFDFSQTDYSLGDFIIYGNTKRRAADLYFGHAEARQVTFRDVPIKSGELIVRGRGPYCELHKIDALTDQGWAQGNVAFASRLDGIKGPVSIRLDMKAAITLKHAEQLFRGKIATLLADFQTDGLPVTKLHGVIFSPRYPQYTAKSFFDISAESTEPIIFKGLPLDHLSFKLYGRREVSHLREVKFNYAEGRGQAMIDVFTPTDKENTVTYTLTLKDANQQQALTNLPQLKQLNNSLKSEASAQASVAKTDARIDIQVNGTGPVKDPWLHHGFGRFEIRNNKLGNIQLLGPLSKILQHTQLNFTTFNLNKMSGDFRYKNESIKFDPLRIDGPRTRINSPGTLNLKDQSLNMTVDVSLFGNAGNPDSNFRKFSQLITGSIPNLLEFELTGTLKEQKLRSSYDPRNLIPIFE
jgi:hypothetical protein